MDEFPDEARKALKGVKRSISMGDSGLASAIGNTLGNSNTVRKLAVSTCASVLFGIVGWYYPRYLIAINETIALKTPPYQITSAGDVILDFTLNEKASDPPIIPSSLLIWTGCNLPFLIVVLYSYLSSLRSSKLICTVEVLTVTASFFMAMGLSEGATQLLKLWIQRRRPSFYDICGFDIKTQKCMASTEYIMEANFSFPSGHSSLSCCGMTFLVWYFLGKLKARSTWCTFLVTVVPWSWTIFVAGSRLVDKWHHPSDVVAGLGLGFATSTIAYHVWYPPVWSSFAGTPRALLDDLDTAKSAEGSKLPSFSD